MAPAARSRKLGVWVSMAVIAALIAAMIAIWTHLQDVSIAEPGLIWNQGGWGELIAFGTAYLAIVLGAVTVIAPALVARRWPVGTPGRLRSAAHLTATAATGITVTAVWLFDLALALVAVIMRPAPECYDGIPGPDDPGGCAFLHAHPFPQIIFALGVAAAVITVRRIPASVTDKITRPRGPQAPRPE
jgi:hypothetical protein